MPVIGQPIALTVEKILFATDFSESSLKALAYVKKLAHHFGSAVTAAHVVDLSLATQSPEAAVGFSMPDLREIGEEGIRKVRQELRREHIIEKGIVLTGVNPASSIIEYAREFRPDLIVMGTKGKRNLERFILGSTAEDVLRHVTCPVLTVGPECVIPDGDNVSWSHILYATDFTPDTAHAALYALSLAQESKARVTLCHIILDRMGICAGSLRDSFLDELNAMVPEEVREWCSPECVVKQGEAPSTILKLANDGNADLVVLGVRPAIHLRTHVPAGVTYKVLASARCPVLTICGSAAFPWNGFFG
ncbi:universal stress protein [Alloacidobacterium dinghuense]|uniref:Universal stress protein n=1 Tax=Alloacidobacterium dinghuense TaxID=2763107 RepID=A0A7G8BFP5_9BACT|nr:universal stress protein [Alloacidobacterium dinghuense]QNI31365.1 universal stress protein [Alloacidobacterium dinghuense]